MFFAYGIPFFLAFALSLTLTVLVRFFALRFGVVDRPNKARKIHTQPTALLGGVAIFISFTLLALYYMFWSAHPALHSGYVQVTSTHIRGIVLAGLILILGGVLDDIFDLPPKQQIIFPVLAVLVVMFAGIGITTITNPFGGYIHLDSVEWTIASFNGVSFRLHPLAEVFTVLWLLGMMFTTKLLDGVDGLVGGIGSIAAFMLFLVSLNHTLLQYDTALLAVLFLGATLGFLVFNWHPAKIFLGEGGALYLGFLLGVLSIIAGGKITTALLVMGLPILDVVWIIIRRWIFEKKSPFTSADKKHLYHRLIAAGLSQRQTVLIYYFTAVAFGSSVFFIQGEQKLIAFGVLLIFMIILAMLLVFKYNKER